MDISKIQAHMGPTVYSQDLSDEIPENSEEIKLEGNPIYKEMIQSAWSDYINVNGDIISYLDSLLLRNDDDLNRSPDIIEKVEEKVL